MANTSRRRQRRKRRRRSRERPLPLVAKSLPVVEALRKSSSVAAVSPSPSEASTVPQYTHNTNKHTSFRRRKEDEDTFSSSQGQGDQSSPPSGIRVSLVLKSWKMSFLQKPHAALLTLFLVIVSAFGFSPRPSRAVIQMKMSESVTCGSTCSRRKLLGGGIVAVLASSGSFSSPVQALEALNFEDVTLGNTGDMDKVVEDKRQVIIDYQISKGSFEGPIIESSKEKLRQPLLFTVGTGAVNPALDEMVRTMRPGGTRRAVVPASYGLLPEREEAFLTVRLRTIKGPSSFNICVVPLPTRFGRADKGLLCQEGARPDAP